MLYQKEHPTEAIVNLIQETTLGSEGACYRQINSNAKVFELDNPLFIGLERNDKAIANITFCRRAQNWYVRYFCFDARFQTSPNKKRSTHQQSGLKMEIALFFENVFSKEGTHKAAHIYAFVDRKNARSQWMCDAFQFVDIGSIATQTYSRLYPKEHINFVRKLNWDDVKETIASTFSEQLFYSEVNLKNAVFSGIKNDQGEVVAFAKYSIANWEITRLPGKAGGVLTKLIPYIPFLNKLIKPNNHRFVVPEVVYSKENNAIFCNQLFESILAKEQLNLMIWWIDEKSDLYADLKPTMSWGLLHRLMGVNKVSVMVKSRNKSRLKNVKEIFITGSDMI